MNSSSRPNKSSIHLWGNLRYRRPFIIAVILIVAALAGAYLIYGQYAWLAAIIIVSVISFLCIIIYTVINNNEQQRVQNKKINQLQNEIDQLKKHKD